MRNKNQRKKLAKEARANDQAFGPNCREGRHGWDYDEPIIVDLGAGVETLLIARCRCGVDTFDDRKNFF